MSTTLDRTPRKTLEERATDAAANVLHLCHTLEGMRDDFIPLLPKLKDETIIAVRMGARAVSVWAWVIECACDHEMFGRVEAQKGGRGNKDEDGEGKLAAAGQQAYTGGKSVRTVYRNAQIIDTFGIETIATHGNTLQDKGFWIKALDAPDPHEAIEVFVEKKTENPFWEVQDAEKEISVIKGKHDKAKRLFSEAVTTINRKVAYEWLEFEGKPALDALARKCPIPGIGQQIFLEAMKQCSEVQDALFLDNAQECVLYIWSLGNHTEKQLQDFTCLPRIEIRRVLDALADKGYFVEKPKAWKSTQGRGTRVMEWHRTDKPMPKFHITLPQGPLELNLNAA